MSKDIKFNFLNSDEEERYQKHLTLKDIGYEGQLNLKNSSVLCIGAGGLGSSVLLYLKQLHDFHWYEGFASSTDQQRLRLIVLVSLGELGKSLSCQ